MIRPLLLALALLASALPAAAHRLIVFAFAEAGEIVVEAKFSNDAPAQMGALIVGGETGEELTRLPLDPSGTTRLPITPDFAKGVVLTIETEGGHSDYWILTPQDLEAAQ